MNGVATGLRHQENPVVSSSLTLLRDASIFLTPASRSPGLGYQLFVSNKKLLAD